MKKIIYLLLISFLALGFFGCEKEPEIFDDDHIMELPPLKDQFASYFLIGNISKGDDVGTGAGITDARLTRHYNALTAENNMKPNALTNGRTSGTISYTWTNADRFVNSARASGMQVIGHTLLWHSQNPDWVWRDIATRGNGKNPSGFGTNPGPGVARMSKEEALTVMRNYITAVASRYEGKIHTWDVLNEIFPDNASRANADSWKTQMRNGKSGEGQDGNPWYIAIGSAFVYEGFLAARLADPGAILYYNDYNTEGGGTRAQLIRDMVIAVNNQYLAEDTSKKPTGEPADRLLIEGIGMQEHHNLGVTVAQIKATIDMFRAMTFTGSSRKIRLSVSELDIIAFNKYSDFSTAGGAGTEKHLNANRPGESALITQANLYRDYMKLYIANADIIERVSLWGVSDNNSWRSLGLPLLFDHNNKAKPAYYRFIEALP